MTTRGLPVQPEAPLSEVPNKATVGVASQLSASPVTRFTSGAGIPFVHVRLVFAMRFAVGEALSLTEKVAVVVAI